MSDYFFLFDLDSIITRQEILPTIAEQFSDEIGIREKTERTMRGELPFKQSFLERIETLQNIPVSSIRKAIAQIPLNQPLVDFIISHKERCFIVTGNLDVWIEELVTHLKLEQHCFTSKAIVKDDRIDKVVSIIDKKSVCEQMVSAFVAIGDGNNDAEMINMAEIGIGYGGVRPIAMSVLDCADYAIYEENTLCQFLERLL